MSDLIDRQAAIDAIEWTWAGKAAFDAIKALPPAQPKWIPVTERSPDSFGNYLVSVKRRKGWNGEEYVVNDIAFWDRSGGFHKADEVVAWMPLPEPYREEARGEGLEDQ